MQGNVYRGFGGGVLRGYVVNVIEYVVNSERVGKLCEVEAAEEFGDAFNAFAEVGGHGSLAVAGYAVVFYLHLHVGRYCSARLGEVEGVAQFEFVGKEREFQSCGFLFSWLC